VVLEVLFLGFLQIAAPRPPPPQEQPLAAMATSPRPPPRPRRVGVSKKRARLVLGSSVMARLGGFLIRLFSAEFLIQLPTCVAGPEAPDTERDSRQGGLVTQRDLFQSLIAWTLAGPVSRSLYQFIGGEREMIRRDFCVARTEPCCSRHSFGLV